MFAVDEKEYHKLCFILAMGGVRGKHSSFILKHVFKKKISVQKAF